jgi:hypothetical protein
MVRPVSVPFPEHFQYIHSLISPGAHAWKSDSSTDSQYHTYMTQGQDICKPTDRLNIDSVLKLDGIDSYDDSSSSQIQSNYDTSCLSLLPLTNTSTPTTQWSRTRTHPHALMALDNGWKIART